MTHYQTKAPAVPPFPAGGQPARTQGGVTLIELMISMLLGIILIFAATTLYEVTKRTTRAQEANARLMENGRAATEILNRAIRMARYYGCAGVAANEVRNHFDTSNSAESPATLNGYNHQGIFGVDGTTDEIVIFRGVDESKRELAVDVTLGVDAVQLVTDPGNPAAGDILSVTDCSQADVFSTSTMTTASGIDSYAYANCPTCTQSYLSSAEVLRVSEERFYIATGAQSGLNGLWVADPNDPGTATELIEGVEDMQISYGMDTDADGVANQYVSPAVIRADCVSNNNSTCWRKVSSVRIALLLATVENRITTSPQSYDFNGTTNITPTDYRLRREFLSIIALRNYRP